MGELLPDCVGISRPDDTGKASTKRRTVSGILEWIKCFNVYMAVISRKQPGRIPDLLAYETLIIEAHMEYSGDAWLGYDIRFRQCAATDTTKNWAIIDPTLWNLAFSGKARATRCKFCFSLSHVSSDCAWVNQHPECPHHREPSLAQYGFVMLGIASHKQDVHTPVARMSTSAPSAAKDPSIIDKRHKAVFCPYHPRASSSVPRPPQLPQPYQHPM